MPDPAERNDDCEANEPKRGERLYTPEQIEVIILTCPGGLPETPARLQNDEAAFVDRRQALCERLEDEATQYKFLSGFLRRYREPAPSRQHNRLSSIDKATQRLLGALGVASNGDPDDIPNEIRSALIDQAEEMAHQIGEFPNHPSKLVETNEEIYVEHYCDKQLRDVVEGIVMLRSWAAAADAIEQNRINSNDRAHRGDAAFKRLMRGLGSIWCDIFEQEIGTSVGKPGSARAGQATGPLIRFIQACLQPLEIQKTDEAVRDQVRVIFQGKGKSDQEKPDPPIATTR